MDKTECNAWSKLLRGHTKSLDANDKLIQTRSHIRDAISSRKRQVIMRKGKSTIPERPMCAAHTQLNWWWRDFFQIKLSRENYKKALKNTYSRLIDFLRKISKLSYFNLLGVADFWCIISFPFRFLMWQTWVCANTLSHLFLQYVHHFELRHYLVVHEDSVPSLLGCFGGFRPSRQRPKSPKLEYETL